MSTLVDRITGVLLAHQLAYATDRCTCGFDYPDYDDTGQFHAAHVAQRITEVLHLTEEWAMDWWDNGGERHRLDAMPENDARKHATEARADRNAKAVRRWVSAWTAVEPKP